jgi:FMN phosphatase YigB (HAD superfamily)
VGPLAVLFDLDDTLLVNPMDTFVPAYFRALTEFMAADLEPQRLIDQLLRATRAMDEDGDSGRTNEEAFAEVFFAGLGRSRPALQPLFDRFYQEAFPSLRGLTRPMPGAIEAVRWALDGGRQVVIATNPLFPRTAIVQRMEWAGLELDELPLDLVTSYENMHATKVRPSYYSEIADRIGRRPTECVMVGDNWTWDVAHAVAAGLQAWWIAAAAEPPCDPTVTLLGQGSLAEFLAFARAEWG